MCKSSINSAQLLSSSNIDGSNKTFYEANYDEAIIHILQYLDYNR